MEYYKSPITQSQKGTSLNTWEWFLSFLKYSFILYILNHKKTTLQSSEVVDMIHKSQYHKSKTSFQVNLLFIYLFIFPNTGITR